jgi:hypothetical protein
MNIWLSKIIFLISSFVEGDAIDEQDPEEDEKIIEISQRENLYEVLAASIGIYSIFTESSLHLWFG